jgi:hypothetical protein
MDRMMERRRAHCQWQGWVQPVEIRWAEKETPPEGGFPVTTVRQGA